MLDTSLSHLTLHDLFNINIFEKLYEFQNAKFLTVKDMQS
jgi:hypothetical protein